jgi:hypothetical protein
VHERQRVSGSLVGPYATTRVRGEDGRPLRLQLHRLILPGVPKIDHRDGDGLNCQRYNLREATEQQNQANRGKPAGSHSSRFKGVHWDRGRWVAKIKVSRRQRHLGRFTDEAEAALAYDRAARAEFGEFAWLNFP